MTRPVDQGGLNLRGGEEVSPDSPWKPTPAEFLNVLYKDTNQSSFLEFRAMKNGRVVGRRWEPYPTDNNTLNANVPLQRWSDSDVYYGVALREEESKAEKEDILETHLTWVDYDVKDHLPAEVKPLTMKPEHIRALVREHYDRFVASCKQHRLYPRTVVYTGHGFQVIFAREHATSHEDTEAFNAALASVLGGDPSVKDRTRILRLPGTMNCKNPERPLPVEVWFIDENAITSDEALHALKLKLEKPPTLTPKHANNRVLSVEALWRLLEAPKRCKPKDRHASAPAFLNLARKLGGEREMAETLKSEEVYERWFDDGDRSIDQWRSEVNRWLEYGPGERERGIPFLETQGFDLGFIRSGADVISDGSLYGMLVDTTRYSLEERGVYKVKVSNDGCCRLDQKIASRPIFIRRIGDDLSNGQSLIELGYVTPTGNREFKWHPESILRNRQALLALNEAPIHLDNVNSVSAFLVDSEGGVLDNTHRFTTSLGWLAVGGKQRFILPDDEEVEYIGPHRAPSGNVERWSEPLRELAASGERGYLPLVVCGVSASAPLVRLMNNTRRPIIGLQSPTSRGKGTAIEYSLSMWGDPKEVTLPASSTVKGVQDRAHGTPDFPVFIDEVQQTFKKEARLVEDMMYSMANGQRRVTSSRAQKPVGGEMRYGVCFFAAEEDVMSTLQKGAQYRVVTLTGDPLENQTIANRLKEATKQHGALARPLVDLINRSADGLVETIEQRATALERDHPSLRGDDARIVALAVAGLGMLVNVTGINLPTEQIEAWLVSNIAASRDETVDNHTAAWTRVLETVLGAQWDQGIDTEDDVLVIGGHRVAYRGHQAKSATGGLEINPAAPCVQSALANFGGERCTRVWRNRGWIAPQGKNLRWRRPDGAPVWRVTAEGMRVANLEPLEMTEVGGFEDPEPPVW